MSESVKIGGIGKNPAIDKINSLNAMDVKNQAVRRMEQVLLGGTAAESREYTREVPVDFVNADWKGERNGDGKKRRKGDSHTGGEVAFGISGRAREDAGGSSAEKISIRQDTTGDILGCGRTQDFYMQHFGKALTGRTGISGTDGNTEDH